MSLDLIVREYIDKFHKDKDEMHNTNHIDRLRFTARELCRKIGIPINDINYALFFHGLTEKQKSDLGKFLVSYGFEKSRIERLIYLEQFTKKELIPSSDPEKLIHDTHVLEGGPYFSIIKSLVTGSLQSQPFNDTIDFFDTKILDGLKCYFPFTQRLLAEHIKTSKEVLENLRKNLPI